MFIKNMELTEFLEKVKIFIKIFMEDLFKRDLGSTLLSIAIILGWLGLGFVFLRILAISIKRILEVLFRKS